ncbi:MAG: sigma-54 dependent transcriptional regulator [Pseudomonadota bacterium]
MPDKILVVDDEPVQRRLLEEILKKLGYDPICVESGSEALDALSGKSGHRIKAVILDLVMPEMDGMAVLESMTAQKLFQPVIVQTAQGGVETAVGAMRAGAVDFVIKPAAPQRLNTSLQNALRMDALQGEIKRIKRSAKGNLTVDEIISSSPNMEMVKTVARKAAQSSIPVLIEGESGVGKELIARAVQGMSERASKSFVTVNCGALPENLAESILFGHEKGAFTGASEKHRGKFQEADGGTLFLDEIGELPADIQVKLLRALQEGEIDPVGASRPIKVNFRLISATNRDLMQEVRAGNFREDLYYRLNVLPILVPPLRERRADIPELLRHFTARIATEEGRPNVKLICQQAIEMLCAYDWPGNIRQLENAVFRAVVLCEGDELTISEFPQIAMEQGLDLKPVADDHKAPEMVTPMPQQNLSHLKNPAELSANEGLPLLNAAGDVISLAEAEKQIIEFAIERYNGQMSKISRKLGIGRSTLYRKLREYGLETDENDSVD